MNSLPSFYLKLEATNPLRKSCLTTFAGANHAFYIFELYARCPRYPIISASNVAFEYFLHYNFFSPNGVRPSTASPPISLILLSCNQTKLSVLTQS